MELEDVVKAHSVGYDIEEVKVEFKHELKMDVSGVKIEGKESEIMNIPRCCLLYTSPSPRDS